MSGSIFVGFRAIMFPVAAGHCLRRELFWQACWPHSVWRTSHEHGPPDGAHHPTHTR